MIILFYIFNTLLTGALLIYYVRLDSIYNYLPLEKWDWIAVILFSVMWFITLPLLLVGYVIYWIDKYVDDNFIDTSGK